MTAGFTLASASKTVLPNMRSVSFGVNEDFALVGRIFVRLFRMQLSVPLIGQEKHAAKGTNRCGIEGCSPCGLLLFLGQRQFKRLCFTGLLFLGWQIIERVC